MVYIVQLGGGGGCPVFSSVKYISSAWRYTFGNMEIVLRLVVERFSQSDKGFTVIMIMDLLQVPLKLNVMVDMQDAIIVWHILNYAL